MDTLLLLLPIGLPLLGAAAQLRADPPPAHPGRWGVGCAAALLVAAIALAVRVTTRGAPVSALGGMLRADALAAYLLLVVAMVALVACAASPAHLRGEIAAGRATARTAARQGALVQAFLAAMALAALASGIGLTWVAIEATTIVTAFLVGQRHTRAAVEAAWKYVVICSTGIALALLGTLLLDHAARHAGTTELSWAALTAAAPALDPGVTRIAVLLLVVGFGTKAGLAPLHAWLPDAHSQAPAPVSALMSGVLLAVAFTAVLRVKVVADLALGPGFARALLVATALASLLIAATQLLAQHDLKRMLAYSSIEHMGLLALGAAAGSRLAIGAVLLHILGHGLAKSALFVGAGHVLQGTATSRIAAVRGLAARSPVLAGCLAAGVAALLGFPPFVLFATELGIVRAGFAEGLGPATAAALVLVVVIAAALVGHTSRMLLGTPPAQRPGAPRTTAMIEARRPAEAAARRPAGALDAQRPADGPEEPSGPEPECGRREGAAPAPLPSVDVPGGAGPLSLPRGAAAVLVAALVACAPVGVATGPLEPLLSAATAVLTGGT